MNRVVSTVRQQYIAQFAGGLEYNRADRQAV